MLQKKEPKEWTGYLPHFVMKKYRYRYSESTSYTEEQKR